MAVDERTWSQFFDSSMDAAVAANFCWFYRLPSIVCLGLKFFCGDREWRGLGRHAAINVSVNCRVPRVRWIALCRFRPTVVELR